MTNQDLRGIFPSAAELPPGWTLTDWWSATRGAEGTGLRRVYLNAGGTDHELRFLVFPPGTHWRYGRTLWPDCGACAGTGRVKRPQNQPSPFLFGALDPAQEYDAADAGGLRRCNAMNCENGRTEPIYGAANSRMRVPDFPADLLRKTGHRGMSEPSKDDILRIMRWCDAMTDTLHKRAPGDLYP